MTRAESNWPRLCLALILGLGFAPVFAIVTFWMEIAWRPPEIGRTVEQLLVDTDGEPLISTYGKGDVEYRRPDGTQHTSEQVLSYQSLPLFAKSDATDYAYDGTWSNRVVGFNDGRPAPTYWYLVSGRGYLTGYDARTRFPIGYIGLEGFSETPPPRSAQFSLSGYEIVRATAIISNGFGSTSTPVAPVVRSDAASREFPLHINYLFVQGRVLKIDLQSRTIVPAVAADDILSVATSSLQLTHTPMSSTRRNRFLLRRPDRVIEYDPIDASTNEYVIPKELRDADFTLYPLSEKGSALAVDIGDQSFTAFERHHQFVWFDAKGTVTRREEVVLNKNAGRFDDGSGRWLYVIDIPSPLLLSTIVGLQISGFGYGYENYTFSQAISDDWPAALLALAIAMVVTCLADRRQRRFGLPRSFAWLAFVFVLGVPGYVGYLLHRRWPIQEITPVLEPTGCEVFA